MNLDEAPSKNIQQVKKSVPLIIAAIGEEVELQCPATGAPDIEREVYWEKVDGELSHMNLIREGNLIVNDIQQKDGGVYRCTVKTDSGMAIVTHVHLKVSDFVPEFDGNGYVELKALTEDQWNNNVDMKIAFKPEAANGLLLYTKLLGGTKSDEKVHYLSVGLQNGHVIYRYDIRNGPAVLVVDADDISEQEDYFSINQKIPSTIVMGGVKNKLDLLQTKFDSLFIAGKISDENFEGSISSLTISNKTMNFGEDLIEKSVNVRQNRICASELCQHNSICIPKNVDRGFICDCSTSFGFEGEFCERQIPKCNSATCENGKCVRRLDGTEFCRCSPGKYGDLCQFSENMNTLHSIQFIGENSYLALPEPSTLRNFSLNMEMEVRSMKDQFLFYLASDYNHERANYLAIGIRDGKFVHFYSSGDGDKEIESFEKIKLNEPYYVNLTHFGSKTELQVNEKKISSLGNLSSFMPSTNIFIGGIPAGIMVNEVISAATPFAGCISKIVLNGNNLNLTEMVKKSSHGVVECKPYKSESIDKIPSPFIWRTSTTKIPSTSEFVQIMETSLETTTSTTTSCTLGKDCVAQCEPDTCGEHGDCDVINGTHISCSCRDYYDGPNCEIFKPIEHAAKFDGKAFIVFSSDDFPHLTSEREETISLRFKTSALYGLIFWQGQQIGTPLDGEDYMSIGINDGYLLLSYELGGGAAQLSSVETVNDGREHYLQIWRTGRHGKLKIDNGPVVEGSSAGILAMLNVEGNIYIGGVPDLKAMTNNLHEENFVGCISDITLNGIKMDLMANAIDGRNVKPCDQWTTQKKYLRSWKYH
ncbi:unnamed protein product [Thelazia callipaeda]|uniref:Basement membrane-specific heparan sulfate proteoglycan core protein n=1 Tax=Thelazia callipaeda TaxID=103827 RepID=A0A0N5CJ62_THECL|nr:unnamed protein product [Thelazia callipaeda]